ncbi:hypothetical protein ABT034_21480 [Streptomyces sp. NPDC002773]|uniref:hypothetical protein n=1 Tax=Streptomyces sp. NPDC002773 TaxID=3154430 RepID=UPI003330911F
MRFRQHHLGKVLAAVGLMAGPLALAAAGPAAADVVEPFGKRYAESLYGDFTTIGNTVRGCPTAPADPADPAARCAAAGGGYGSSSGRLAIPAGAEVAYARLFWGGNDGTYQGPGGAPLGRCGLSGADAVPSPGDPSTTAPVIRVGAGPATPVSIDSMVTDPAATEGPHYYTGESDVTAAFKGLKGTDAQIAVGNIWAANGRGCVAGWSLTVVHAYTDPDRAPERRSVHVYGGHVLQRSTSPATRVAVDGFHRGPGTVRASVTAYGGDRNAPGAAFLVNGKRVTESRTRGTDGFLQAYDIPDGTVPPGATSADLAFTTSGDTYVPAALAFSVPVPDPKPTKTASAAKPKPTPTPTPTATRTPTRVEPTPPTPTPTPTPMDPTPASLTQLPAPPAPPAPGPHGNGGSMAETGGNGERLWLLGALALALAATGLVAKAAMRGRHD